MNFKRILKSIRGKSFLLVDFCLIIFLLLGTYKAKMHLNETNHSADINLVNQHLETIVETPQFRNHYNIEQLNSIADYIFKNFNQHADKTVFQEYKVDDKIYKNVICSFGTEHQKRIIIGAHYDVCGDQKGADDNATGVTALLELSRMLKGQKLNYRIDLVAYTLEEPPFFRSENMGSYIHAKYLKDNNIDVYGMASVEMIGYFKDEKKSQGFPLEALSWIYGDKGDFITLVQKFNGSGKFARNFIENFKGSNKIKTEVFPAPKFIEGIDFSDHLNYWKFGYSALMITDTSFFRNENYHKPTDTLETLDLQRMCKVIDAIFISIINLK